MSKGTVFPKLRADVFAGKEADTGWAEWSVENIADVNDVELWYECNPAMGYQLNERKIRAEDKSDELDFNIQRLGYWAKSNLKSEISVTEWESMKCKAKPNVSKQLYIGVKYGRTNVSVSVATKADDGRIFFEAIDCQPIRNGNAWVLQLLTAMNPQSIVIDGSGNQNILKDDLEQEGVKNIILPTVKEVIVANAKFEQMMYQNELCHMNQPSLKQVATNCQKRSIGANGGFGYKAFFDQMEIGLLDSCILAIWQCSEGKEKKKQRNSY